MKNNPLDWWFESTEENFVFGFVIMFVVAFILMLLIFP